MASSSRNPRPASPVEGDLQKLYNEVWAVFSEENNNQSSERDLENIYNGYADIPSSSVNPQLQPPYSRIGRSPSPAPVNTRVEPSYSTLQSATSSSQSPTRRRLPPTPGGSTSSAKFFSPPTFPMPEPTVYHSAVELPSSDLGRRTTASSDNSIHSRRLPVSPTYTNGSYRFLDDGERTPDRSDVLGPYINERPNSTNPAASVHHRPPGPSAPALPPKPAGYNEYSYASSSNPYLHDGSDVYDDYQYEQKHVSSTPPPPPPPKLPQHINERYYDANAVEFSDFNLKNGSLKNEYFDRDYAASSSDQPEAGPSSIQTTEEQQNWDPSAYGNYEDQTIYNEQHVQDAAGHVVRRPTDMLRTLADYSGNAQVDLADEETEGYWEEDDEDDESRFVNYSLLSHIAMQLRDKVTRGTHVKGSIPYPRAFTGKDIVSTIQTQIQRELAINHGVSTNDRRVALQAARSLQSQLFFYEVEWGNGVLKDGVEDVYMFMGDMEGGSDAFPEAEELPTGVITMLTRCYSPSCVDGIPCYSYTCPRRGNFIHSPSTSHTESPIVTKEEDEWAQSLDPSILAALPKSEINRQNIIHKLIAREKQYLQDLDIVETVFIKGIRTANPPVLQLDRVEDLIDDIFGNILDLRETNRRLLEVLSVRQREEGPIIQRIGDIFLGAADEFRYAYPIYIGHYHVAEKRLKEETDTNSEFRLFLEQCSRQLSSRSTDGPRLDLKHFLNRPSEHLQKYPVLLEAVQHETAEENPDSEFLREAIEAIKNLQLVAQLRTFQAAMGKGTPGKWEWHDIVPSDVREKFSKKETKRQSIIFELIKGEMSYVKDLENIYTMYIEPLRKAEPPIIPRDRLDQFIDDVFHNYMELYEHHKKLVDNLHEIQREQHPHIRSITAALFDAALNFRDAYMEYIPNYPIAAYRIDDEMANNLPFKTFVDQCVRHPDAHRLDMKNFINRPIPRLLRYELLLKGIMEESPPEHEDHQSIPNVIDVIKALGKETEPGVQSAKQKVEVWRYNANLQFKQGESIDLDLLNPNRSLIHSGKLLRQPDSGLEWNGWSELHVLLFDNYLVMTKTKEKEGVTKYQVNRRPIPLDLLTLVSFSDPPTQRSTGILRNLRVGERHDGSSATPGMTPESANDSRSVFPLTIHHNGRMGGPYILYAESAQIRAEWKLKLEEALGLRKAVQESNKVFEVEYLSRDTFMMPSLAVGNQGPTWNQDNQYTGKVTCSVPFNTPDGRALVAIGCTEGVWIGFRHDPKSIRRVLHLKMVTQCAMLEDFGIFLVLADKALFAYHIEALVPSTPHGAHTSQVPQKLSGTKDVHFFSVGTLQGRTLIIYMKKKSLNSIFRVLEPVGDKINEGVKAPAGFGSRLGFRSAKSEWFRIYRDFFLPSDSFDVIFLKARIAIFCAKGFEIMNLHDFDSITIPQREDPRHAHLAKRCENARPLGMFRSTEEEFLLCYDEFGLYVDKHGDPCRSFGIIEWEGTAERVAFHAPYILLFDSRFIEIRHIESGRLAQIIPGNEIRCIWDGRGISPPINSIAPDPNDENAIQEAQVHFVMNSTEVIPGPGGTRSRNIVQHVCELIPTVPLYPTPAPTSAASVSSIPQQLQYSRYGTGPTHMPTHSYASSSASTAQLYVPTASSQYTPPSPANSSYTYVSGQPQPSPSNSYYTRAGYYENSQHGAGSIHRI